MGYTHYFTFDRNHYSAEERKLRFARAVTEIQHLAIVAKEKHGITLADGSGAVGTQPVFDTENGILMFNGESPDDYETFLVETDPEEELSPERPGWSFCKTQHRPYDLLVCCALIALKNNLPEEFSFSSDGDIGGEDWHPALCFYEEEIGESHAHSL